MLCDECHQRPATVHMTRVVNGDRSEQDLCEHCAREKGDLPFMWEPKFSIHQLLAGLLEGAPPQGGVRTAVAHCPSCGLSYVDFSRTGLLGCADCYRSFRGPLDPLVRRIHGAARHAGKVPRREGGEIRKQREIERLRAQLRQAVEQEDFERAAKLRDEVRRAEGREA